MTTIDLPKTLTARFEADAPEDGSYYYKPETGTVFIEFGGYAVAKIQVTERADRFVDHGNWFHSARDAEDELSSFVASWLSKIFMNALIERG